MKRAYSYTLNDNTKNILWSRFAWFIFFLNVPFTIVYTGVTNPPKIIEAVADIVIGQEKAPITVIEYSSLNCTACAAFHQNVFPKIKKHYIDTGKVKFIFRHFPLDEQAVHLAAIVSTAPSIKQFLLIEKIFATLMQWAQSKNPIQAISSITNIPLDVCNAALKDPHLTDTILKKRLDAEKVMTIDGTPMFIINGRIIDHGPSFEEIKGYLEAPVSQPLTKKTTP